MPMRKATALGFQGLLQILHSRRNARLQRCGGIVVRLTRHCRKRLPHMAFRCYNSPSRLLAENSLLLLLCYFWQVNFADEYNYTIYYYN